MCRECDGKGERINAKDRCKHCNGKKVNKESKILEVHIDKGVLWCFNLLVINKTFINLKNVLNLEKLFFLRILL